MQENITYLYQRKDTREDARENFEKVENIYGNRAYPQSCRRSTRKSRRKKEQ